MPSRSPSSPQVYVAVLGPFEVRVDSDPVGPAGGRRRGLLALLALEAGRVVPVEALVDRLWGDAPPASAVNLVQTYVSAWRKHLGGGDGPLRTVGSGYCLELTEEQCDLLRFRSLARAARSADPHHHGEDARGEVALDEALSLWRGRLLADLAGEPFHDRVSAAIEEEYARAVEEWAGLALELRRDPGTILERLQELRRSDPLRETTAALVMWAQVAANRPSAALQTYDEARTALRDELGADPAPVLRDMHTRVLRGDPSLLPGAGAPRAIVSMGTRADPLFGREDDIAELSDLLLHRGLVTLTGPGGAGKTRLASEVLQRHLSRGGAGWFVDLAPIQDDALVPAAVAVAVDAPATAGTDPTEALLARLSVAEGLLVLDNAEHLPAAAELVGRVRASSAGVLVLVTSRQPLGISGEQQFPVSLLAVPDEKTARTAGARELETFDGVRLLVDRATAADPAFRLTQENAAAVAEVVRHVDGLPLAIEIVAPWLRLLGPDAMVDRLSSAPLDLTARRVDIPERQRSLRSTIQWSYDLLSPQDRAVFRRLAVFVGSFSVRAAGHVCVDDDVRSESAAESLLTLVDCHLVRPAGTADGGRRFRLLETVREFAGEELSEDPEREAVRDRHVSFMSAWAAELAAHSEGADSGAWLAQAVSEADNLRSALRRVEAAGDAGALLQLTVDAMVLWFEAGHEDEGDRRLRGALAAADGSSPARAIGLLYWAWLSATRDRAAAAQAAEEALALAREGADPLVEAFALQTLGDTLDDPVAALRASHAVFDAADRSEGCPVRYGPTAPDAVRCGASASIAASWAHRSLDTALDWQRDALRLAELEGDRRITAVNAARLAHLHLLGGDTARAQDLLDRARTLVSSHVTARWEDIVAFAEAELALHLDHTELAERQLRTLVARTAAGGRPLHHRLGSLLLVDLLVHEDRLAHARSVLDELARTPGALDQPMAHAGVEVRRARLDRLEGRRDAAAARLGTLAEALPDDQVPPERVLLLVERALLAGTAAERRAALRRLAEVQSDTGVRLAPWEQAQLHAVVGADEVDG